METQTFKFDKTAGWFAVIAPAFAQQDNAGINAFTTTNLYSFHNAEKFFPLAMIITGLLLIPKVFMSRGFGNMMSFGGEHSWTPRTVHPRVDFFVHFLYYAGVIFVISAIVVLIMMVPNVIIVPLTAISVQPKFQILISLIVAVIIYGGFGFYAKAKSGTKFGQRNHIQTSTGVKKVNTILEGKWVK